MNKDLNTHLTKLDYALSFMIILLKNKHKFQVFISRSFGTKKLNLNKRIVSDVLINKTNHREKLYSRGRQDKSRKLF